MHLWVAIAPLLHTNTGTIAIQKRLFYTPILALLECKRGCFDKSWCHKRNKTSQKRQDKSLKQIFIL